MHWQSTPYVLPLIVAVVISVSVAAYAWRHGPAAGTRPLAALMLAVGLWSLGYALELSSAWLPAKLFWDNVAYLGVELVPATWLAFAMEYTGRERLLTRRVYGPLAVEPVVFIAVLLSGDSFGLIRSHPHTAQVGAFTVLASSQGAVYWINVAYSYAVVLAGIALLAPLLQGIFHTNPLYRGQAGLLLFSVAAPMIANALSLAGLIPWPGLDLAPFVFSITGLTLAWCLTHYHLLDVIPVARDTVIESMSDAVLVLDMHGRVLDLNPAARQVLGVSSREGLGSPLGDLFPAGRAILDALAQPSPAPRTDGASETNVFRRRGNELVLQRGATGRSYRVRVTPLLDHARRPAGQLVALEDITEFLGAAEALRDSEARTKMIFEYAPIGIALLDTENRILKVNAAFREMTGYDERELAGSGLDSLTHPDDIGKSALLQTQMVRGTVGSYTVEQRYLKKSRETLWAELTMTAIANAGGRAYRLAMISNIFERKRAELLEDEKRHVAYELHDGLAQVTAGAHLHLQAFAAHYHPRSPETRRELERALQLCQRSAREARQVIAGLRPTVVEELGLSTALRMHVETLRADGWDVSYVEQIGPERLPAPIETALFRVALEALTNVRKHARTTQVRIALVCEAGDVCLEVRDWGRGFAPTAIGDSDRVGHIGLHEIRDRVALLGGQVDLESSPGEGTRMFARIPIPDSVATGSCAAEAPLPPASISSLYEVIAPHAAALADDLAGDWHWRGAAHGR
jgi:PAS domain S-box-containing protein